MKNKKTEKYMEEDREELLKKCQKNFPGEDLQERFGKDAQGYRETMHLTYVLFEIFDQYILQDPAIIIDEKLYKLAHIINMKMFDMYQEIGGRVHNVETENDVDLLKQFSQWSKNTDIIKSVKEFTKLHYNQEI